MTLYLPLGPHAEIEILLTVRTYNGIDSDPGIILGEPSLADIITLRETIADPRFLAGVSPRPTLP